MNNSINWDLMRSDTKSRALEFVNASELDRVWYIAGEIVSSAIIFNAWDENIHEVCKYQLENGRMTQPSMAEFLIEQNT